MYTYSKLTKDLIGATCGLANWETSIWKEYKSLPINKSTKTPKHQLMGHLSTFMNLTIRRDSKEADVCAATLLNEATSLFATSSLQLRDGLLSQQLGTLACQLNAIVFLQQQIVGIRLPLLFQAFKLVVELESQLESMLHTARAPAQAKLRASVNELATNLPVIIDYTTFDMPPIISVGLSEPVKSAKLPVLGRFRDVFQEDTVTLPDDGPSTLFGSAIRAELGSQWYPLATGRPAEAP